MKLRYSAASVLAIAALGAGLAGCGNGGNAAAGSNSGCTPAHQLTTLNQGTLQVSVYVSPPYTDLNGTQLSGVDGQIIAKIAQMECLTLKPAPIDGAAMINSVISKRADLAIGGIYYTDQRKEQLNLSDPMYRDGMAALSKTGISTVADMKQGKIGVIQGYLWNAELQRTVGQDHVTVYQNTTEALADLQAGRVNAVILTSAEASYRAKSDSALQAKEVTPDAGLPSSQKPGKVILAETKGNDSLTTAFNSDIAKMLQDGTIKKILSDAGLSPDLAGSGQ